MKLQELIARRSVLLREIEEIDKRETSAGKNYLEHEDFATRNTELQKLGNDIIVAQSIEDDRKRRSALEDRGEEKRGNPGGGLEDPEKRGKPAGPFKSFGEQMQAVVRSQTPGNPVDPRLLELRATGQSEGVGADGGFLVQTDMTAEIWRRAFNTGQILSRVRSIPITSNANGIRHPYLKETSRTVGNRYGGIRTYRRAEAATVTSTKAQLDEFRLELESGFALVYLTDELMADAPQFEAYVGKLVSEAIAFHMEDEIINGNGVGRCLGILNAGCLVSVAKEAGQAAATIVPDNIVRMRARLFAPSRPSSIWISNQDIEPQLHLLTKTDSGGTGWGYSTYLPANGLSGTPFDTLYGRPVVPVEHCPTLGTVGDLIAADFSQYVLIEKGGVNVASSIHVQFIYGESVLRFSWRNNGRPGYAWNDGALTPAKGTNTQSPFVALATRA
jgi:HK97 family phage major capsid protein